MDYVEKTDLIRSITVGIFYFNLPTVTNGHISIKFREPSVEELCEAASIYRSFFDSAVKSGALTKEEALKQLEKDGVWTSVEISKLENLQKQKKELSKQIEGLVFQKKKKERVEKTIEVISQKIKELELVRGTYDHMTAEYMAEVRRKQWLLPKITEIVDPEFKHLLQDNAFIYQLIVYYYEALPKESQIRELARSSPWRNYWSFCRESGNYTFGGDVTRYTDSQFLLVSWSKAYDFAFESDNRPDDSVLNNDTLFDEWYSGEVEKMERARKESKLKNGQANNDGKLAYREEFIVADPESAADVYNLNNPIDRNKIKKIQQEVSQKGEIREGQLKTVVGELDMARNRK
jgi:hypothetical protein